MEASVVQQSENLALKLQISDSGERVKKAPKSIQHRASSKSTGQRRISTVSSEFPSRLTKPTLSSSARSSNSLTVARRNSSGDLRDKSAALSGTKRQGSSSLTPGKKPTPSASDPGRRSLPEVRRTSSPSGESNPATKMSSSVTRKSLSVLPGARSLRTSTGSDLTKPETAKKIANRTASSVSSSASSSRRVSSALLDSSGSSKVRRTVSKSSSPTSRSPSVSSKSKTGSLSASSGKSSNLSGRKKATTPDSKDSSLIILPQVDDKASDEVHLRLEENPILQMPHLEAAPILLVGPTLKKINERDPCQEEIAISKRYPAHTVSCIKDDWELCHPEHAVESTSCFLNEKWKNGLPPGYVLKESSMDRPFEGDACHCHFELVQDGIASIGSDLVLKYQWFIGEKTPTNFRAITNATSEVYWPNDEDIDRVLKVECIPVIKEIEFPSISAISSPVSAGTGIPKVLNLDVHGELVEGSHIKGYAQIAWCGGIPGKGVASWLRKKWNSSPVVIVGAEDEEYQLTIDDLDSSLVFMYTPVTEDGVKGEPQYKYTDIVKAGPPTGHSLQLHGSMVEGQQLRFTASYSGGEKGNCLHEWFRVRCDGIKEKLSANDFLDLTLEDVGNSIEIVYMPVRNDGATGSSVSIISDVIAPAFPEVSNVCVKELSSGVLTGKGDYFGGSEGLSLFSWYRENIQGTIVLISGATSKTYEVTDSDYNCHLLFGYMPVRSDSVVGELRLSEPTDIILPEIPKIELLTLTGEAVEGELLTAVEVIPESEIQQHVWSKYKGNIKYQWFISCGNVDMSFEPLPLQCSCSYQARCEDIGHFLKCECVVTDTFGRSSEPEYAKIGPVLPGIPRISKLEIEGKGFHTNLYAVHGIYNGGKEGNSKVQWLRSMVGCPDFIPIPGETGRMYEANVDDVGYRLVVVYTPIREDGLEGQPMLTSTEPIAVEPDVLEEVKQKMDLGALKFEVLCDTDQSPKMVSGIGSFERRILEINQKHVKVVKPGSKTSFPTTKIRGSYAPPFHVELFRNDQHRLRIVVDSENQVDLMVQTQHMRDIIVLVIRGLAQRFNSTSLNSLLKMGS